MDVSALAGGQQGTADSLIIRLTLQVSFFLRDQEGEADDERGLRCPAGKKKLLKQKKRPEG